MAKTVLIIGAGIVGASLAYHLSAAGADVTVLDSQARSGGVATPNSWAWINASWGNPEPYVKLRMQAMSMWRSLPAVHPLLAVNWCGGLLWDLAEEDIINYVRVHHDFGYKVRLVDRNEAQRLEPHLTAPPLIAAYAEGEGMIEPADAVSGFMLAAEALGARFVGGQHVSELVFRSGRVEGVRCKDVFWPADDVVLAAGAATGALLKSINIELGLDVPAGLLVHTQPTSKKLNGLIMSPEFHVRQTAQGRLVLGSDFGGTQPGEDPSKTAAQVLAKLPQLVSGTEDLEMEYYTVGYRPTPADGFPAMGRPRDVVGLYLAVMHSGITLAPAVGAFGADEILNDRRNDLLSPYHPDRLIS